MKNFMVLMRDPSKETREHHVHFEQFIMDGYSSKEEAIKVFKESQEYRDIKKKYSNPDDIEIAAVLKD